MKAILAVPEWILVKKYFLTKVINFYASQSIILPWGKRCMSIVNNENHHRLTLHINTTVV